MLKPDELDVHEVFHRVNDSFIRRLELIFAPEDLVAAFHLQANANDLQCQIEALCVVDSEEEIDYVLVDFLGIHLKPQVYEASTAVELFEDCALLFTHNALRGNVKHVIYRVSRGPVDERVVSQKKGKMRQTWPSWTILKILFFQLVPYVHTDDSA